MTHLPPVYAIYKNPSDYPNRFVLRRWIGTMPDDEPLAVEDDLDSCRDKLPEGLVKMKPDYFEDPVILEVWM